MASARKIVVSIAISADGYIARPDGDVTWLGVRGHKETTARLSTCRPACECRIEGRARNEARTSISKNYEGPISLTRSYISRFSAGTGSGHILACFLACPNCVN